MKNMKNSNTTSKTKATLLLQQKSVRNAGRKLQTLNAQLYEIIIHLPQEHQGKKTRLNIKSPNMWPYSFNDKEENCSMNEITLFQTIKKLESGLFMMQNVHADAT